MSLQGDMADLQLQMLCGAQNRALSDFRGAGGLGQQECVGAVLRAPTVAPIIEREGEVWIARGRGPHRGIIVEHPQRIWADHFWWEIAKAQTADWRK